MRRSTNGWNVWQELDRWAQQVSTAFDRSCEAVAQTGFNRPAARMQEHGDSLELQLALPGIDPTALDISVTRDALTLKGKFVEDELADNASFRRRERAHGEFEHEFRFPTEVDPQSTHAEYVKGVLSLRLQKPAALQPHKVQVQAG